MKTYKEMAEMLERKVEEAMQNQEAESFYFCGLADSWLACIERDQETTEVEKQKKYEKVIDFIEKKLESTEPHTAAADRAINLTFTYIAIRQKLEQPAEGERKAQMVQVTP